MAKLTLTPISTFANGSAVQATNENYDRIEVAVENTLSRDGTTPNQMEADIDLNGNDLLNVKTVNTEGLILNGVGLTPSITYVEDADHGDIIVSGGGVNWAINPTVLSAFGRQLINDADSSEARSTLGVSIGTNVQAYDADLTAIAAISFGANSIPYSLGSNTWASTTLTPYARTLLDDVDDTAAKVTLGLGSAADESIGTSGATVPLLSTANTWSAAQTIAVASSLQLTISRTNTANNAVMAYTTLGGTVYAGSGDGTDWAVGLNNNVFSASTFFKINATTATFNTDIVLAANKAISFSGTGAATTRTNLLLSTGTYTPTLTNTTNIAASTPYVCQWTRNNNMVTVSGKVDIDVTAAGNALLGMSLPVASALTSDNQMGGTFVSNAAATPEAGCIFADATNDRASFKFIAVNTANNTFFFSFMYQVL